MAPEVPIDAKSREKLKGEVDQMKNLNLAADAVLIACPKCHAWPMAANIAKPSRAFGRRCNSDLQQEGRHSRPRADRSYRRLRREVDWRSAGASRAAP
jgi:hypothetical protein